MVFITDDIFRVQWLLSDCQGNKIGKLRRRLYIRANRIPQDFKLGY